MAYLTTVLLLMLVLPVGSIWVEQSFLRGTVPLMMLVGKWFVFWAAGGQAASRRIAPVFSAQFLCRRFDLCCLYCQSTISLICCAP
jgi:hypothetical protein